MKASDARALSDAAKERKDREALEALAAVYTLIKQASNDGLYQVNIRYLTTVQIQRLERDGFSVTDDSGHDTYTISWSA